MKRDTPETDVDDHPDGVHKRQSSVSSDCSESELLYYPWKQKGWVSWESIRPLLTPDTLSASDFKPVLNIKWGYHMQSQEARRRSDGLVVAMKGYEPTNEVEERKTFAKIINQQIGILEKLSHSGIVTYLGHFLGEYRINLLFAFDHDAPDLEQLAGERNISEAEASHYALQLAEALDHIHGQGAILRALDTVGVKCYSGYHIKLVELDTLALLDSNGMSSGEFGESEGRAPEMLGGGQYGTSVDWWCLGILLYYLTTYRKAFHLSMHPNCLDNPIITCNLKFPRTMSDTMRETISLLLKKDPNKRISSLAKLEALPIYSNIWPPRPKNKLFWR